MKPVIALTGLAIATTLLVGVPSSAFAVDPDRIEATELAGGQTLKAQSLRLIQTLRDIAVMSANPDSDAMLSRAEAQIQRIPDADFAVLAERGGLDLGPLLDASDRVQAQMASEFRSKRPPAATKQDSSGEFQIGIQSAGFPQPGAVTAICNGVDRSAELRWSLAIAVSLAEEAVAAASRVCDETIVAAGFGGNTSLVCLPLDIAFAAARAFFDLPQFCADEDDGALLASVHDRAQHIHDDLEAARLEVLANDDANTAAIQANDDENTAALIAEGNANRDAIINNDNANRELLMAQIESLRADLKALSCDMIRLLNTPEGRRSSELAQCSASPGFPFNFPER